MILDNVTMNIRMKMNTWSDIPNYEGIYQVSESGEVKALGKRKMRGRFYQERAEKLLKQKQEKRGYRQVTLCKDGIRRCYGVHQLVAIAFIENPLNKPTVNHKDGNKSNNNKGNLEWATGKEQINHADSTGLRSISGENHKASKLTNAQVIAIRAAYPSKNSTQIAAEYGLYRTCIHKIVTRKTWKHI